MLGKVLPPTLSESELTERQCKPRHHSWQYACAVNVQEQLRIRHQIVKYNPDQKKRDGHYDTVAGNPAFGQLFEKSRCLSVLCQCV
ncbi:hypothetical protein D3C74_427430 [compost metagenome]